MCHRMREKLLLRYRVESNREENESIKVTLEQQVYGEIQIKFRRLWTWT